MEVQSRSSFYTGKLVTARNVSVKEGALGVCAVAEVGFTLLCLSSVIEAVVSVVFLAASFIRDDLSSYEHWQGRISSAAIGCIWNLSNVILNPFCDQLWETELEAYEELRPAVRAERKSKESSSRTKEVCEAAQKIMNDAEAVGEMVDARLDELDEQDRALALREASKPRLD